jgi:multimeric flavodoxin WrbA
LKKPKTVIAIGSPRKDGNSATLAQRVIDGVINKGGEVDTFFLHYMHIQPCDACRKCRDNSKTDCLVNDDMKDIYPKLRQADALVIASPIFWFSAAAQTKLFMDRCYALGGPQGNALKGKQIGIVLSYGGVDPFSSGAVNALRTFQDTFKYLGSNIVGTVYGSASEPGEIKNNLTLMDKAFLLGKQLVNPQA